MNKSISPWDYLWYALYAFAGLGMELVLISFIEPLLWEQISADSNTAFHSIAHWLLTIVCWGIFSWILILNSRNKLDFNIVNKTKPALQNIAISGLLAAICVGMNVFDWGTLKIIGEFQKKGPLLFSFQYLYYIFEVILVFLIVVFGQKFFESLFKKSSSFPWGGVVLCLTWGTVHILTQGSLYTGLGVMVFSLLYGMIYIVLGKNTIWSYIIMTIAFIL